MVKTKKIPKLIALLMLFCQFSIVSAQPINRQDLKLLKNQAADYIVGQIPEQQQIDFKVNVRPIDKRLKLQNCDSPVDFSITGKLKQIRRNGTIKASCTAPKAWQVFIPYQAVQLTNVLVAIRDIEKGEKLTTKDVRVEKHDLFVTRNASFTEKEQVSGTHAKSALRRGEIVSTRDLCSVCKGQPVAIYAVGSGLSLKTDGVALQDGIPGQFIRVENSRSGKAIRARVVAAGRVQVNI